MQSFADNASGGTKLEIIENSMTVLGNAVVNHGLWKMSGAGPDGTPYEATGRFLDVSANVDGTWVYTLDYPSVPMPVPDPEAVEN
jgi:ketosteroid isomerase-like protein